MESENKLNIFEFNEMMNNAKIIYSKSEKKFFVDVRKQGSLILFHMTTFNCTKCNTKYDEVCENPNMTLVLDIIETKLNQKLLIQSKRIIESQCETDYYFVFLAK